VSEQARIGFIGLGQMGAPMARNLASAGGELVVFDVQQEAAAALAQEIGARAVGTAAEVGRTTGVVILMLPNGAIVRDVVLGKGGAPGLADTMAPGATIIDMSSSDPVGTQELGAALAERGLLLVDAPVSGGVKRAVTGELAIMVGGDAAAVEAVQWILRRLGKQIFHAGPLGAGHAMKALNNYVSAAGLVAAADAVRIGAAFGLQPATVVDILNASTGRNNSTENKFHQFILSDSFASGFSLGLMAKDLGIARSMSEKTRSFAPLLECCAGLWAKADAEFKPRADHTEIFRYLQERDGGTK
jgi:3-hydroxyisobutyrate dehydrogenase